MSTNKDYIMALTGITSDQYNDFVFTSAIDFLMAYYSNDESIISALLQDSDFWAWYKNNFNQMDEAFSLRFYDAEEAKHIMALLWEASHAPENMIAYPNQYIIEKAMQKIWTGLITKQYHSKHG